MPSIEEILSEDIVIEFKDRKTKTPIKYNQRPMNDLAGIRASLEYDIRTLILLEALAKNDSTYDMKELFAEHNVNDVALGNTMAETIKNIRKRRESKEQQLKQYCELYNTGSVMLDAKKNTSLQANTTTSPETGNLNALHDHKWKVNHAIVSVAAHSTISKPQVRQNPAPAPLPKPSSSFFISFPSRPVPAIAVLKFFNILSKKAAMTKKETGADINPPQPQR